MSMEKSKRKRIKVFSIVTRIAMDSAGKQAILITESLYPTEYQTKLIYGACEKVETDMTEWATSRNISRKFITQMKREIRLPLDFIAFLRIFFLMLKERPQVVHTRTSKAGCIGRIAAHLASVPVIIHTYDGHVFSGYFSEGKTKWIIRIEKFLAKFTDKIIAISNHQKKEIDEYLDLQDTDKIQVIHLGFDFKEFAPPSNGALREELGISPNDYIVGYVGRLAKIKRLDRLISAFALVSEKIPNCQFVIVGDGEESQEVEHLVKMMKLQDKVHLLGVRKDVAKIYSGIDVIALSSDNEGTPAVLIEAMHYGKPVVATNVGGIPDVVTDGVSGLLTKVNGPEDIAESIIRLLSNDEMRKKMGKTGSEEVRRKFSLEALIKKLDTLYLNELCRKSAVYREHFADKFESRQQ